MVWHASALTAAGYSHKAIVTVGKHPNDLLQFRWVNTLLGNLKTSFSAIIHAFIFDKYTGPYLCGFCFNRRFSLAAVTD